MKPVVKRSHRPNLHRPHPSIIIIHFPLRTREPSQTLLSTHLLLLSLFPPPSPQNNPPSHLSPIHLPSHRLNQLFLLSSPLSTRSLTLTLTHTLSLLLTYYLFSPPSPINPHTGPSLPYFFLFLLLLFSLSINSSNSDPLPSILQGRRKRRDTRDSFGILLASREHTHTHSIHTHHRHDNIVRAAGTFLRHRSRVAAASVLCSTVPATLSTLPPTPLHKHTHTHITYTVTVTVTSLVIAVCSCRDPLRL
ncbi:hypothetical protein EJ05DRAFT_42756 [Pseudovirgaria hyperparasitica]|uniref:Uncharacterized protein n=1 Tax=Pseudovirgaria hyperparasitica TaxID=470096 RepID=A0A6A6WNF2_9PEZI|nr:uncharacterized protein EJ05DRAFT_42756 [Pseudovirgaria hyperparasitica]KAF2763552.1 hypothetical protein EJ05DRAFT_42756 [Pseudovirgaria hyperparasitica]